MKIMRKMMARYNLCDSPDEERVNLSEILEEFNKKNKKEHW